MSEVIETLVQVTTEAPVATFTGDLDGDTLKTMLIPAYPFLANSVYSERVEGNVRYVTFSESLGTKG